MPDRDLYVPPSVSTEEVYRLILTLRGDIRDTNTKLDSKPSKNDLMNLKSEIESKASKEAVSSIRTELTQEIEHLEERIVDLESWQTWAMRLGIPGLIGVIVNLLNTVNGAT